MPLKTKIAQVDRIKWSSKDSNFMVLQLKDHTVAVGEAENVLPNAWYKFVGRSVDHARFGRQFKFQTAIPHIPDDTGGIIEYLSTKGKWVGPKTARLIVEIYQDKALDILKSDPIRVSKEVSGITRAKAVELSNSLKESEKLEEVYIEFEKLCMKYGLPHRIVNPLIRKYGSKAIDKMKRKPYELVDVHGISFTTADHIALSYCKVETKSIDRKRACAAYMMKEAVYTSGNTVISRKELEARVSEFLGFSGNDGIQNSINNNILHEYPNGDIALKNIYHWEKYIGEKILAVSNTKAKAQFEIDTSYLNEEQSEAAALFAKSNVMVLCGAPGTGKTYTTKAFVEGYLGGEIVACAPTGKAAKRMTELVSPVSPNFYASTIHRALKPHFDEGCFVFEHDESNPIPSDFIIIDEFSMVDVWLADCLFGAIKPGTKVLIVGDPWQLPSVGPGSVLRDIINSGKIPTFTLKEIQRNAGDIVKACHQIKDGEQFVPSEKLDLDAGYNLRFIATSSHKIMQDSILNLIDRMKARDYDPIWDVQVITPIKRSEVGCVKLNEILQRELNPNFAEKGKAKFCRGDKVIQTKNEFIAGWRNLEDVEEYRPESSFYVVNGDLGRIKSVNKKNIIVEFFNPHRICSVFAHDKANKLELAYALTVHKMQGSEAPVIIFPMHKSYGNFPNRQLVYTAISRSQDICICVGETTQMHEAIKREGNTRQTRLWKVLGSSN